MPRPPHFSIIIPTLDEEAEVADVIDHAFSSEDCEVIVSDGGSRDRTCERARRCGARVELGTRGRARQMNRGADAARGECLAFLHADTRIPMGGLKEVWAALRDEAIAMVAFSLRIDHPASGFRVIEAAANLRSRALGLPYGDQVFCLRRSAFMAIGGFRDDVILEDVDLVRRAHKRGRVHILSSQASTSPRRWLARGLVRTSLTHQLLLAGHGLRIPPRWLERARRGASHAAVP